MCLTVNRSSLSAAAKLNDSRLNRSCPRHRPTGSFHSTAGQNSVSFSFIIIAFVCEWKFLGSAVTYRKGHFCLKIVRHKK